MLSEQDLDNIVDFFREKIYSVIGIVGDIKARENSILVNYYMNQEQPSYGKLVEMLKDPSKLRVELEKVKFRKVKKGDLPNINRFFIADPIARYAASIVNQDTDKFSFGRIDDIIIANKVPSVYTYPSGLEVKYNSLENEKAANINVLVGGYNTLDDRGLFIRKNFVDFISAFAEASKEKPELEKYKDQFENFGYFTLGIVLAHEICEQEYLIRNKGKKPERSIDLELIAEKDSVDFLNNQKVDKKYYELHHKLRSYSQKYNISQMVVNGF